MVKKCRGGFEVWSFCFLVKELKLVGADDFAKAAAAAFHVAKPLEQIGQKGISASRGNFEGVAVLDKSTNHYFLLNMFIKNMLWLLLQDRSRW